MEMFQENAVKYAELALKKPDDFGYWGDDDMFNTWGYAGVNKTRDSQNLELSNFHVITKDLMERHPDDFRIERYSHWLVGWVEQLCVRILKKEGEVTEDNITDAFIAALGYQDALDNYPVIDDDHYSEICYEELIEYIKDEGFATEKIDQSIEDWEHKLAHGLLELHGNIDMSDHMTYLPPDDFYWAIYQEKIYSQDREWFDFWTEFTNRLNLTPIKYDFIKSETDQTLFDVE